MKDPYMLVPFDRRCFGRLGLNVKLLLSAYQSMRSAITLSSVLDGILGSRRMVHSTIPKRF
jgi:hypothetical protein